MQMIRQFSNLLNKTGYLNRKHIVSSYYCYSGVASQIYKQTSDNILFISYKDKQIFNKFLQFNISFKRFDFSFLCELKIRFL